MVKKDKLKIPGARQVAELMSGQPSELQQLLRP